MIVWEVVQPNKLELLHLSKERLWDGCPLNVHPNSHYTFRESDCFSGCVQVLNFVSWAPEPCNALTLTPAGLILRSSLRGSGCNILIIKQRTHLDCSDLFRPWGGFMNSSFYTTVSSLALPRRPHSTRSQICRFSWPSATGGRRRPTILDPVLLHERGGGRLRLCP